MFDLGLLDVESFGVTMRRDEPANPFGYLLDPPYTKTPCYYGYLVTFVLSRPIGSGHGGILKVTR